MSHQERALAYLRHYAQKNLAEVSTLFAEDITLRDWKIMVRGKAAAVEETRKNFAGARSLEITPLKLYDNHDTVAVELHILVDGVEALHVVDVITFNPQGLIQSIRAYLGRGDNEPH